MLVHMVTGSSWEDRERICGNKVSDTTARAKLGWKWSILTGAKGIPIGWTIDGRQSERLRPARTHFGQHRRAGLRYSGQEAPHGAVLVS